MEVKINFVLLELPYFRHDPFQQLIYVIHTLPT